jgi:hypothetical protein
MALGITRLTLEEAASKYCRKDSIIPNRVEDCVIRTEPSDSRAVRINVDKID